MGFRNIKDMYSTSARECTIAFRMKFTIVLARISGMSACGARRGHLYYTPLRPKCLSNRLEAGKMRKPVTLYLMMILLLSFSARAASNREDDIHRIEDAAQIFQEIMSAPDKAIPQELLDSAKCIAIIPAEKKLAFFVGGNYGKGLVTCRGVKSWSRKALRTFRKQAFLFCMSRRVVRPLMRGCWSRT